MAEGSSRNTECPVQQLQQKKKRDKRKSSQNQKSSQTPFDKRMSPSFENYLSEKDVQHGLKCGKLFKGVIRINQKNYEEAFVDDPNGGPDYCIVGVHNRNRALHEDSVVIQVLPEDKWLKEQNSHLLQPGTVSGVQPDTASAEDVSVHVGASSSCSSSQQSDVPSLMPDIAKLSLGEQNSSHDPIHRVDVDIPLPTATPDPLSETQSLGSSVTPMLIDKLFRDTSSKRGTQAKDLDCTETLEYRRTAKVVCITGKTHSRVFAGYLRAFSKEKKLALISPRDSKAPRVVVPLEDCPEDYPKNPKKYETCLFVCQVKEWPEYSPFPTGNLTKSLGESGEIEGESEAILLEHNVDFADFSKEINDSLPQLPWSIPKEEELKRRDFRKDCVLTIDPETARDLDDAVHIKHLNDGVYEVGVHIADVGYFIDQGSALDHEASQRATSVYLVQKVIPMLPRVLSEHLCSLNPNEDKLTVSVVWHLTLKGELISQWIGRSIIRSCVKLSYGHAQSMIDGTWQDSLDSLPPISGDHCRSRVADAVCILNKLANVLRSQRKSKGTLRLNQPKLSFALNRLTGFPCGCEVYPIRDSNRLIEEFMLLANMTVARVIHEAFPETALLRAHPKPKQKAAALLVSRCARFGISLNMQTASTLQASLDQYKGFTNDEDSTQLEKMILVAMCSRVMNLAHYFASHGPEKSAHHFALNVPLYTHFTSPIRRYADIIVHRQLVHALGEGSPYSASLEEIDSLADVCNQKKKAAKIVGDLSIELFFAVFLKKCGPVCGKGMVVQVLDKSFDVLMKELGVIKRVYCDKLPLERYSYEEKGQMKVPYLTLVWSNSKSCDVQQVISIFTVVEVVLLAGSKSLQFEAKINQATVN